MERYSNIFSNFDKPQFAAGRNILKVSGELKKPRAILFDVYETLLASTIGDLESQTKLKLDLNSFIKTAHKFGFSSSVGKKWAELFFTKIDEEHSRCNKLGIQRGEVLIERIWHDILRNTVDGDKKGRILPEEVALYRELIANPVAPFEDIVRVWEFLKGESIYIGIVSNAQFYTLPILEWALELELTDYLHNEFVILSYKLGFAKPDPHFFRYAERQILQGGLKPADVWVVGNDPINDIRASKPFGFVPVLFVGSTDPTQLDKDAAAMVGSYTDLLELIKNCR